MNTKDLMTSWNTAVDSLDTELTVESGVSAGGVGAALAGAGGALPMNDIFNNIGRDITNTGW